MKRIKPFEPQKDKYTIVDNVIFDHIMPSLSPNAWKVLCFILRKTRGYHKEWDEGSKALFPNARGCHLTRTGVRLALRRRCELAGVVPFRVHDLRHSYVVHMLRRGVNPQIVSDQAGHASVAFTLTRYGREADEQRRLTHLQHAPGDDI